MTGIDPTSAAAPIGGRLGNGVWTETYSPPAYWEWPSSNSPYLSGAQLASTHAAAAVARQRPSSAALGPVPAAAGRRIPSPTATNHNASQGGLTARRTSTAPSGSSRPNAGHQQQQPGNWSSPTSLGPWVDGVYIGSPGSPSGGVGHREGSPVGRLILGLPLSPRSQKRQAAAQRSTAAHRSPAVMLNEGSSPSSIVAASNMISYFSRRAGGLADQGDDGTRAGRGGSSTSGRGGSGTSAAATTSNGLTARGGFVGGGLQRVPPRRADSALSAAPAGVTNREAAASPDPNRTRAANAAANVSVKSQTSRAQAYAAKDLSVAMPFLVLDGDMVAGTRVAQGSFTARSLSHPVLSISGHKVHT